MIWSAVAFVAMLALWAWGPGWAVAVLSWFLLAAYGTWAVLTISGGRRRRG